MYARVIPLTKLPRRFDYFDYTVPEELEKSIEAGHIVVVSFRNRKIYGIVRSLDNGDLCCRDNKGPHCRIKPIELLTDIILPKILLQTADWASNYYLVSPSLLYKLILPAPTQERDKLKYQIPQKTLTLTKEQSENVINCLKELLDFGRRRPKSNSSFLYDNGFAETLAVFIKLVQKKLEKKEQVLFLVPSPQDINRIAPYLKKIFNDKLIIWHGKLSAGKKFSSWKKILSNESCVVLGTRPACFLPFSNLSLALIYNYNSPDHKQWDQNPRYDARKIIENFPQIQTIFSDILPDLPLYNTIKNKEMLPLNMPDISRGFSLVDLRKEKSLFGFPIYQMIKEGLNRNQQLILFLNRREKDSLLICNNCRHIFTCDKCEKPILIDKNEFLCYYCNIKKPAETMCPECKKTNLRALRFGAESIKKLINKELPDAQIEIAAKTKNPASNWDVLITTDYFWKNVLPKVNTNNIYGTALLDFDFYLLRPEFNQKESALVALHRFLQFSKGKKALVQTNNPENEIFGNFEKVYEKELAERKEINYPPYSRLVKIICKAEDRRDLDAEAKKLYDELTRASFSPLPPFEPFIKKRTKNYLKHIVLKEPLDKNLGDLKKIIPDEYQIDVDAISIY